MSVQVKIPRILRKHTGDEGSVEASPGTVSTLLTHLSETYPGLSGELFDEGGELHRFVNIYVNDEDIRYIDGLDTKVSEGDEVSILPAVAGGTLGM